MINACTRVSLKKHASFYSYNTHALNYVLSKSADQVTYKTILL